MTTPRHEFYETDEKLTLSVFDKGADPAEVSVKFQPRSLIYTHGEKVLSLEPLKGQIDTEKSDYTVGKVKVEVRLVKAVPGRWGGLVGDSPDPLSTFTPTPSTSTSETAPRRIARKNWDGITTEILSSEKPLSSEQDPNVGGDSTVNEFFQKIFADADEDTRRAMMKSYQESGGTSLSTNWEEVKKSRMEVKPPEGSEWKKWGV
ncbi:SGS-domain-containing protein [Trametopsis cervina]|nr:SGS-domain-containing protein [Trametopsis cervina]